MVVGRAESESKEYGIAYFYCNYSDDRNNPASILSSLVKQLCIAWPDGSFPRTVETLYKKRELNGHAQGSLTTRESTELLVMLSAGFRRITIFIDALDECGESRIGALLDTLVSLVSLSKGSVIKIFVTSRDEPMIRNRLQEFPQVFIQHEDITRDIEVYIASEVQSRIDSRELLNGMVIGELRTRIIHYLQQHAHGRYVAIPLLPNIKILKYKSFNWVKSKILEICKYVTASDIDMALEDNSESMQQI